MAANPNSLLALDVGAKRIGVAVATLRARLPAPLITLSHDETFFAALENIVAAEQTILLVVGFPRGLEGQHTAQTAAIESFTNELHEHFDLPIHFQDEALTSKHAEAELKSRGRPYTRAEIDALAATYILEDFLSEHQELV